MSRIVLSLLYSVVAGVLKSDIVTQDGEREFDRNRSESSLYKVHPYWQTMVEQLAQAYADLAHAVWDNDLIQVDEEHHNVNGLRGSAAHVFGDSAVELDMEALVAAFKKLEP